MYNKINLNKKILIYILLYCILYIIYNIYINYIINIMNFEVRNIKIYTYNIYCC